VAINFQLVIDCADPERLSRFWAAALRYEPEPVPAGFATWEARRLTDMGATMVRVLEEEGLDHYGLAMADPEGNEFDIN
jgi:hypothetical protein